MKLKDISSVRCLTGMIVLTVGCALLGTVFVGVAQADPCNDQKCLVVQIDTCAMGGGSPPPCDDCAGLFMPCWNKYCYYEDKDCLDDPQGGDCQKTLISAIKGLERDCVRGSIDWINCLGQPECDDSGVDQISGNRYDCSVS